MSYSFDDIYKGLAIAILGNNQGKCVYDAFIREAKENPDIKIEEKSPGSVTITVPAYWSKEAVNKAEKVLNALRKYGVQYFVTV